jgi:hypothetical protein
LSFFKDLKIIEKSSEGMGYAFCLALGMQCALEKVIVTQHVYSVCYGLQKSAG